MKNFLVLNLDEQEKMELCKNEVTVDMNKTIIPKAMKPKPSPKSNSIKPVRRQKSEAFKKNEQVKTREL